MLTQRLCSSRPHAPLLHTQESRITRWLHDAGALRATAAEVDSADEAGERASSGEEDAAAGDDGGAVGWRRAVGTMPPCPSCGRTYPHEHIRGLRSGGLAGSDSD